MVGFQSFSKPGIGTRDGREPSAFVAASRQWPVPIGGLKVEVGLGNSQQGVIGCSLETRPVGGQTAAGRHRLEDCIRDSKRRAQTSARGSRCPAMEPGTSCQRGVPPRNRELRSTVCTVPVTAGPGRPPDTMSARRKAKAAGSPGLLQVGRGLKNALPGDRDIQVPCSGQLQRVGQVDRLDGSSRYQGRIDRQPRRRRRRYASSLRGPRALDW